MLVLGRKMAETITMDLGDGRWMSIKVVGTGRGSVRLGIEAPDDVRIYRGDRKPPDSETPPSA